MTVCKFFLQGNCKFGDRCRFDHPVGQGTSQPPKAQNTRPPPQNRYAPLQPTNAGFGSAPRNNGPGPRNNAPARRSRDPRDRPYGITRQTLEDDLRAELPQWIMSAYGPGKDAPIQLFGGFPREQSFEELRVQHYLNMASGNPQQTPQMEQELAAIANQQIQNALGDLEGAIDYIVDGTQTHPNRLDMLGELDRIAKANNPPNRHRDGVFARSNPRRPPINQPNYNQNTPPANFGAQFGQQPQQQPGIFGQPPQPGVFGQPLQTNTFGQPSQQPGAFVQSQQANDVFSQSQPQPGAFGQQPQQQGVFGQPQPMTNAFHQQPQQQGVFGIPSQQVAGFEQPIQLRDQFGQASQQPIVAPPGDSTGTTSGFFSQQPIQQQGVFGQPPVQEPNDMFSRKYPASIPFGQPQPSPSNIPGFGTTAPLTNGLPPVAPQINGFQQQSLPPQINGNSHPVPRPTLTPYNPDPASYSTHDATGKLLTWKGRQVSYIDNFPCYRLDDGTWERIWFANGPPQSGQNNQNQMPPEAYNDGTRQAYEYLRDYGVFQNGVMPEVAPNFGMVRFDL